MAVVTKLQVGERLKQAWLNSLVTAIQDLQGASARTAYEQVLTGKTVAAGGAAAGWGAWPTAGGFTSSSNGVTVPSAGVYAVTQTWDTLATGFTFTARSYVDIEKAGSVTVARSSPSINVSERVITVTAILELAAGGYVGTIRYQGTAGAMTGQQVTLRIARVSA